MTMDFSAERLSYEKGELIESHVPQHPKALFEQWVKTAVDQQVVEPYAMSLATCGSDNVPSVRTVLMREVCDYLDHSESKNDAEDSHGQFSLIFYSNYDSAKGKDIEENPNAQVLFFWHSLERQVRLTGSIQKLSVEKSTEYFHKRPQDSQIAAWVSEPQSGVVENRGVMEAKFSELKQQYDTSSDKATDSIPITIPMPEFWGGYELVVNEVEFWQGRANRMHDRLVYNFVDENWQIQRLLP